MFRAHLLILAVIILGSCRTFAGMACEELFLERPLAQSLATSEQLRPRSFSRDMIIPFAQANVQAQRRNFEFAGKPAQSIEGRATFPRIGDQQLTLGFFRQVEFETSDHAEKRFIATFLFQSGSRTLHGALVGTSNG